MIKLLKNKKGVTMVELMAGLMLFTISVSAIGAVLAPMMQVYSRANELAEVSTLLDGAANHLISDLASATAPPQWGGDTVTIEINNTAAVYTVDTQGVLRKNGSPVLPGSYYRRHTVSFGGANAEPGLSELTVTITNTRSGVAVSREYAVRPLMLND
ncbi:MAG: hypothetical protein FWH00_03605 [Oscillospiraceae bacterium]|nr:hypothetical protein [Oscillospiraceae bacterium]